MEQSPNPLNSARLRMQLADVVFIYMLGLSVFVCTSEYIFFNFGYRFPLDII